MKFKLLLLFALLLSGSILAQVPQVTGSPVVLYEYRGGLASDSVFAIPWRDTLNWTGSIFRKAGRLTMRPQDSLIYYHNGVKWQVLTGSSSNGGMDYDTLSYYVTEDQLLQAVQSETAQFVKKTDSVGGGSINIGYRWISLYYADTHYLPITKKTGEYLESAVISLTGATTVAMFTTSSTRGAFIVDYVNVWIKGVVATTDATVNIGWTAPSYGDLVSGGTVPYASGANFNIALTNMSPGSGLRTIPANTTVSLQITVPPSASIFNVVFQVHGHYEN